MKICESLLKKFFGREGVHPACCDDLAGASKTPIELAERRYAQGELTQEEFQAIKKDLLEEQPRPDQS